MRAVLVKCSELQNLIESHDEWVGSIRPEDQKEYLEQHKQLKFKLEKLGYIFMHPTK